MRMCCGVRSVYARATRRLESQEQLDHPYEISAVRQYQYRQDNIYTKVSSSSSSDRLAWTWGAWVAQNAAQLLLACAMTGLQGG